MKAEFIIVGIILFAAIIMVLMSRADDDEAADPGQDTQDK